MKKTKTKKSQNEVVEVLHQGDVMLVRRESRPEGALDEVPRDPKRGVVLAYGEVTGHAHALVEPDAAVLFADTEGRRYLDVNQATFLAHEEHSFLSILPGFYEVITPVEYVPKALPKAVVD